MFDQNPMAPSGPMPSEPRKQSPPPLNLPDDRIKPAPAVPRPPQVEDIFSETETPSSPRISRPMQPGQASQMAVSPDVFGGRSMFQNKALVVLLSLIGLAIIGGVVFAAVSFFTSKTSGPDANLNANINTNVNTNTEANANTNTETNGNANANENANINAETNANANANVSLGPDSDNDGLSDEEEKQLGTNPNNFDTDGDGLIDRVEVRIYNTDPLKKDTDGDGYNDGDEVVNGFDPAKGGGARLFNVP
ncbi:MAG: hypothetical protein Q7K65_01190 [Candidatus Buchananbacteria bacterium]|nr:hypothetical protein [Candidatus Buchananbacteria bacterium]